MPPHKTPASPQISTEATRIQKLRDSITAAQGEGVGFDSMVLRLTSRDASALKRHPAVAVHEITFAAGEMRFLGVKVQEGGVPDSVLERTA